MSGDLLPPGTFAAAIQKRMGEVEVLLGRIEQDGAEADLHDLRAVLVEIANLIEHSPGISAAVDDLYDAATTVQRNVVVSAAPDGRLQRFLREAKLRLEDRLASAEPSDEAKRLGLS